MSLLPPDVDHEQRVRSHQLLLSNVVAIRRSVRSGHAVAATNQARYTATHQSQYYHSLLVPRRYRLLSLHSCHLSTKRHSYWYCHTLIRCSSILPLRQMEGQTRNVPHVLWQDSKVPTKTMLLHLLGFNRENIELSVYCSDLVKDSGSILMY